jgi:hypothetical protein
MPVLENEDSERSGERAGEGARAAAPEADSRVGRAIGAYECDSKPEEAEPAAAAPEEGNGKLLSCSAASRSIALCNGALSKGADDDVVP